MSAYRILELASNDPLLEPYSAKLYSDFLKSLINGNHRDSNITRKEYFRMYHELLEQLLAKPGMSVRFAVLEDDLDVCLGWCLFEGETLHYVYVNQISRNQGIAKSIVPEFNRITLLTKQGEKIRESKFPNIPYVPFK